MLNEMMVGKLLMKLRGLHTILRLCNFARHQTGLHLLPNAPNPYVLGNKVRGVSRRHLDKAAPIDVGVNTLKHKYTPRIRDRGGCLVNNSTGSLISTTNTLVKFYNCNL